MRISPSVIVMSLLVAAPFALAIRGTLRDKSPAEDDDSLSARTDRKAAEDEAEQLRKEAADEARAARENIAKLDTLFGADKASIGSVLGGADLGTPLTDAQRLDIDRHQHDDVGGLPTYVNNALADIQFGVAESIADPDSGATGCSVLRAKLAAAWGPSVNGVWINPQTHHRARVEDTPVCSLTFESYLEPADWVSRLPIELVGQPSAKLAELAGPEADIFDDEIGYKFDGVGYGTYPTRITGAIEHGKVVGFELFSDTDPDSVVAIRGAISSRRKEQPVRDEETDGWVWKKKPRILLLQHTNDNGFELRLGQDTAQ